MKLYTAFKGFLHPYTETNKASKIGNVLNNCILPDSFLSKFEISQFHLSKKFHVILSVFISVTNNTDSSEKCNVKELVLVVEF